MVHTTHSISYLVAASLRLQYDQIKESNKQDMSIDTVSNFFKVITSGCITNYNTSSCDLNSFLAVKAIKARRLPLLRDCYVP